MRVHFKIYSDKQIVPFNHQHLLTGTIHKWLGWNQEHGEVSLFSFSQLVGGKRKKDGLVFTEGSSFFFSAYDAALVKKLIEGVQKDAEMFNGFKVTELIIQENPDLSDCSLFYVAAPIFIKRKVEDRIEHILYGDNRANECLKETLETKLQKAGLADPSLEIQFKTDYPKAGTKLIHYKNIKNKSSWCPVIIKGKPETKVFAWNVGLGNSTGIGFGAIK
jgi:CRISPR-associated endoribonuclease Cas6